MTRRELPQVREDDPDHAEREIDVRSDIRHRVGARPAEGRSCAPGANEPGRVIAACWP